MKVRWKNRRCVRVKSSESQKIVKVQVERVVVFEMEVEDVVVFEMKVGEVVAVGMRPWGWTSS